MKYTFTIRTDPARLIDDRANAPAEQHVPPYLTLGTTFLESRHVPCVEIGGPHMFARTIAKQP